MNFFLNKLKWYILLKPIVIHPAQGVRLKVMNHTISVTRTWHQKPKVASTKNKTKLHETHT